MKTNKGKGGDGIERERKITQQCEMEYQRNNKSKRLLSFFLLASTSFYKNTASTPKIGRSLRAVVEPEDVVKSKNARSRRVR